MARVTRPAARRLPLAWRLATLGAFEPPTIPEDLSGLSDDQLRELAEALVAAFDAARPEANTPEAVAELGTLVDGLERVRGEETRRAEAAAAGGGSGGDAGGGDQGGDSPSVDDLARRVHGGGEDAELAVLATASEADRAAIAALDDAGREALRQMAAAAAPPPPAPPAPGTTVVQLDTSALGDAIGQAVVRAQAEAVRALEPATLTQTGRVPARARRLTPFRQFDGAADDDAQRRIAEALAPIRPTTEIFAGADIPGFGAGQHLDLNQVAEAFVERRQMFRQTPDGVEERHLVASFRYDEGYPEERRLHRDADHANTAKYEANVPPWAPGRRGNEPAEALVASGGLCAPVTPLYDIMTIAGADRPVRDSYPSYVADRGGVRFIPPPQWDAAAGAIGYITAPVDAAALGGSGAQITAATKPCLHVTCPGPVEYDVSAVTRCLEFGNFTARAYPEQVQAWLAIAMAQQARLAETKLIDAMVAASTAVLEVDDKIGAGAQLLSKLTKNAAYMRNRNRMPVDAPLNVYIPAWAVALFQADFANRKWDDPESLTVTRGDIEAYLSDYGLNAIWYRDSGTGKGQLINGGVKLVTGGPVLWPANVVCYLTHPGAFMFLDGGTLDFGIVRDSSLNALNNYRMFTESFEQLAFVGVESLELTFPVLPTGLTAGEAYGSSTLAAPTVFGTNANL